MLIGAGRAVGRSGVILKCMWYPHASISMCAHTELLIITGVAQTCAHGGRRWWQEPTSGSDVRVIGLGLQT